jgi:Family of unknown function (DUF6424)
MTPENPSGSHVEREDHPWELSIPDHAPREDSPAYRASRKALRLLVAQGMAGPAGASPDSQDHHGGGLPVRDRDGWFLVRNLAGVEWSAQWGADPAKVDRLRETARRLYGGFPDTITALQALVGDAYDVGRLLDTPITDAGGVAAWVDSVFNASVPLPAPAHTGVLPGAAGAHHYPAPVQEIPYVARDDLRVFVETSAGPAAVVPVAPRGSGDGRVEVLWAHPGTKLHANLRDAHAAGHRHVLDADHELAQQAFASQ